MMILALESSATACSAALCRDGELVAQSYQNSGLTHSRTLLPMVRDMLANSQLTLDQVDVIAVAAGPGSFTGLRIGVATVKGLAWPEDKDCAPCSTLESMAWPLAHMAGSLIICAMDARRKQVYNALFLATGTGLERLTPDRAISLEDLGAELKNYENSKIVVGDGAKLCYNTLTEEGIPMALAPKHLRMQSHKQYLFLPNQHHPLFGTRDSGVEQITVHHDGVRFEQRHNNGLILRAHSLVDRSSISQIHIAQIIYAVFQCSASAKIHADFFTLVSVLNIPDEAQISIRDLFCVLGLHDAVIDPEDPGAKLDFFLRRAEWVDQFTNGFIQLFRRRGAF